MDWIKITSPWKDNQYLALIQLNRPEVLNAISTDLMKQLVVMLQELNQNPNIRCAVITGNERAFAAGADIKQMAKSSPIEQLADQRFQLWKQFEQLTFPIIAAVDGFALGAGCELAMACDFIIASHRARFGQPEINIGTIPGAGGTMRLTRLIGKSRAMKMVLTGEIISAEKAANWGMVAEVVATPSLLQQTYSIAEAIAKKSPIATRLAKENINFSQQSSLNEGLNYERRNFYLTFASKDQKEGMNAFVDKRDPQYIGE